MKPKPYVREVNEDDLAVIAHELGQVKHTTKELSQQIAHQQSHLMSMADTEKSVRQLLAWNVKQRAAGKYQNYPGEKKLPRLGLAAACLVGVGIIANFI